MGGAGLDQRQVDLHDIELHLAEEPESGVAGPDVVRREPQPSRSQDLHVAAKLVQVLDRLPFRQLEHDPVERDRVTAKDALDVTGPE